MGPNYAFNVSCGLVPSSPLKNKEDTVNLHLYRDSASDLGSYLFDISGNGFQLLEEFFPFCFLYCCWRKNAVILNKMEKDAVMALKEVMLEQNKRKG